MAGFGVQQKRMNIINTWKDILDLVMMVVWIVSYYIIIALPMHIFLDIF